MLGEGKIKGEHYWTEAWRKAFLTEWLLNGSLKIKEYSYGQVLLALYTSAYVAGPSGMPSLFLPSSKVHMFFKSQYKGHKSSLIILALHFLKEDQVFPPKIQSHFNSYSANTLSEMFDSVCWDKSICILYTDEKGPCLSG